jgi:hypothetical protein
VAEAKELEALKEEILRAAMRVDAANVVLHEERLNYRDAIRQAHERGMSITALAKALGVSRTRVRQIMAQDEP